ncbi:hypothetical protein FKW77_002312 [Venturia effusa]|uniref:Uncharacterized protein n=1 Tax=Venturia effusa TaxID=50376 RepID=A0A517LPN9_9PEZI|nr:hypothetical protein FKW77_002312 [Venturia effusa]
MCVGQETLHACGHTIVVPMVIFDGDTFLTCHFNTGQDIKGAALLIQFRFSNGNRHRLSYDTKNTEIQNMCVGQETLHACGHTIVVPMVIFDGDTSKCPCPETFHVESGSRCGYCVAEEEKQMFRATNPRATETEKEEESGEQTVDVIREPGEDEHQLVCGRCNRGDCGKCGGCVCCEDVRKEKKDDDEKGSGV